MSPIYTSVEKESPIDAELMRLNVPISMPRRQINGVPLDGHEYHRFVVLAGSEVKDPSTGKGLKAALNSLVKGNHPLLVPFRTACNISAVIEKSNRKGQHNSIRIQLQSCSGIRY